MAMMTFAVSQFREKTATCRGVYPLEKLPNRRNRSLEGPTKHGILHLIRIVLETRYLCAHVVVEAWLGKDDGVKPYCAGNLEILGIIAPLFGLWRKTQFFDPFNISLPTRFKEFFV